MKKSLLFIIFSCVLMQPLQAQTLWECSISDEHNLLWKFSNEYEKKALNMVFEICKKESTNPLSCDKKNIICEAFVNGISITPLWECTAFDANSDAWMGKNSTIKDEAAISAKALCRSESSLPETCYIHFVTCLNKHEIHP